MSAKLVLRVEWNDAAVACRTGVIFCVFQANQGESEESAKRELRAREELTGPPNPSALQATGPVAIYSTPRDFRTRPFLQLAPSGFHTLRFHTRQSHANLPAPKGLISS